MNAQQALDVAAALAKALDETPPHARAVRAWLRSRVREYKRAAKLYDRVTDEDYPPELVEIVTAGAVEKGMTIATSVGARRVVAISAGGIGYSDCGATCWENRDGTQTPFVVIDAEPLDEAAF